MSTQVEGDRKVVRGRSGGSHFPKTQAESLQRFEADGTTAEGPFHIEGSLYGRNLRFRGPGAVLGPVLGRGDVIFLAGHGGPQRMLGGVHSAGNVVCDRLGVEWTTSLLASPEYATVVVRGDIVGEHVSLADAVVFGNVRGRRVSLTRSIVFGQVIATESASIGASTLLGYECPRVRFAGPCCMVFACGTSVDAPVFAPLADDKGVELAASVVFRPALRALGSTAVVFRPWDASDLARAEAASLHPADWVRAPVEVDVRRIRDGKAQVDIAQAERYVLSIAGRALNFAAITPHLMHASWMLRTALEFDHYSPRAQERAREQWRNRCTADEGRLLEMATSLEVLRAQPAATTPPAPRPSTPATVSRPPPIPTAALRSQPYEGRAETPRPNDPRSAGPGPAAASESARPSAAPSPPARPVSSDEDDAGWPSLYQRWIELKQKLGEPVAGHSYASFATHLRTLRARYHAAGRASVAFEVDQIEGRCQLFARDR